MTGGSLAPAVLVLLAVWLFIGPRRRVAAVSAASPTGTRRGGLVAGCAVTVTAGSALVWGPVGVIWSAAAAMVAATVGKVSRDHRRRQLEHRRSREVSEAARALAGRLSVGEVPSAALSRVAAELTVLAPVQHAQEVGADVPAALLAASGTEGQESFAGLGRAWRLEIGRAHV